MSDDDMIRRGDVLRLVVGTAPIGRGPSTDLQRMIRATPAADARAEALDGEQISRAAKFMAMALWSELHEKAGPGVLPEKLPKAAADVLRALMQEKLKTALIGGAE